VLKSGGPAFQCCCNGRKGAFRELGRLRSLARRGPFHDLLARLSRNDVAQLYDQNEVQRALAAFYRNLAQHMPQDRVTVIDADGSVDVVHERVWAAYEGAFRGRFEGGVGDGESAGGRGRKRGRGRGRKRGWYLGSVDGVRDHALQ